LLIQWPKQKVTPSEYDYAILLLAALAPQSTSQDLVSPMTGHIHIFPQHKKNVLFQTYSGLRYTFIHTIPSYTPAHPSHAHQHPNLSLFLRILNNICPWTPISGHKHYPTNLLLLVQ